MLSAGKDRLACRAEPRRGSQGKDNLEKRLCRGIADGELRLYFQPLVTAQSRNCARLATASCESSPPTYALWQTPKISWRVGGAKSSWSLCQLGAC